MSVAVMPWVGINLHPASKDDDDADDENGVESQTYWSVTLTALNTFSKSTDRDSDFHCFNSSLSYYFIIL